MVKPMNEKSLKLLVDNGVVKKALIKSTGAKFHIEIKTVNDTVIAQTNNKQIKTWTTIDSAAKWLKKVGIGRAEVDFGRWQPGQRSF
jgi:predicted aspartyl protease